MDDWPDVKVDTEALRAELRRVMKRRLSETFKYSTEETDRQCFPKLARIVQLLEPDIWKTNKPGALADVMRKAVNRLPESNPRDCATSWRHIGITLCDFRTDLESRAGGLAHNYDSLIRVALTEARLFRDKRTFGRNVTNAIRKMLATILIDMESEARASPGSNPAQPSSNNSYIRREKYYAQFAQLVEQGAKLIAFVGQAGMGKTWLALYVANHNQLTPVPIVRVFNGELHKPDIRAAASLCGIPSVSSLAELLLAKNAPSSLVLDNLQSLDELTRSLPRNVSTLVIVTARSEGVSTYEGCYILKIGALEDVEAVALVKAALPTVSTEDAEALASALHGHPLMLRYACGLIATRQISVQQFCDDLTVGVSEVVKHVYTEDQTRLLAILRQLVSEAEWLDPLAVELLCLLSLVYPISIIRQDGFLRRYLSVLIGEKVTTIRYVQSLEVLRRFQLVDMIVDDDLGVASRYFYGCEPRIDIHPLTHQVLFEHFKSRANRVYLDFGLAFDALLDEMREMGILKERGDHVMWDEYRSAWAFRNSVAAAIEADHTLPRWRNVRGAGGSKFYEPFGPSGNYSMFKEADLSWASEEVDKELFGEEFVAEAKRSREESRKASREWWAKRPTKDC